MIRFHDFQHAKRRFWQRKLLHLLLNLRRLAGFDVYRCGEVLITGFGQAHGVLARASEYVRSTRKLAAGPRYLSSTKTLVRPGWRPLSDDPCLSERAPPSQTSACLAE